MKDRILSLLGTINKGIYEKETELSLSLMAALAGESVILLGPPGVAKSMVARRLKLAFKDARSFEYLMSRFSTPDEIFGPVSISKLKDADKYERNTEGYLPTADVVFLCCWRPAMSYLHRARAWRRYGTASSSALSAATSRT